jgi:NAD(P)-dependent dehydrogenase (short-subunit alcohol dehydrogenase family)
MDLNGKVVLVTGAARRVGRAIATAFAAHGADIALHYGRSEADAHDAAEEIRSTTGQRVELCQADLANPDAIESMVTRAADTFGHIDVLVNNAGVYKPTPLNDLTAEQWDFHMAINARAPALCIRHIISAMPDDGCIINITDIAAEKGWAGYPAYCASKAALLALTKSTAKALARRNIRVNAIAPGVAEWSPADSEAARRAVLAQVPLKRPGTTADIASAAIFLAQNDYITAQTLRVDGGWHMG